MSKQHSAAYLDPSIRFGDVGESWPLLLHLLSSSPKLLSRDAILNQHRLVMNLDPPAVISRSTITKKGVLRTIRFESRTSTHAHDNLAVPA